MSNFTFWKIFLALFYFCPTVHNEHEILGIFSYAITKEKGWFVTFQSIWWPSGDGHSYVSTYVTQSFFSFLSSWKALKLASVMRRLKSHFFLPTSSKAMFCLPIDKTKCNALLFLNSKNNRWHCNFDSCCTTLGLTLNNMCILSIFKIHIYILFKCSPN